jgi:hypothetical protein
MKTTRYFQGKNKRERIVNAFFSEPSCFLVDNLGNKSMLIDSTPIFLNRGQSVPPRVQVQGSMTLEELHKQASDISFTIRLHSGPAKIMFFPNIALKVP